MSYRDKIDAREVTEGYRQFLSEGLHRHQERWEKHRHPLAPLEALIECGVAEIAPPDWLIDALVKVYGDALESGLWAAPGRNKQPLNALKADWIDQERAEVVARVRHAAIGKSPPGWGIESDWSGRELVEQICRQYRKEPFEFGRTWNDTYEDASALLEDSIAAGGAEAIRASCNRVRVKAKTGSWLAAVPTPYASQLLGEQVFSIWSDKGS